MCFTNYWMFFVRIERNSELIGSFKRSERPIGQACSRNKSAAQACSFVIFCRKKVLSSSYSLSFSMQKTIISTTMVISSSVNGRSGFNYLSVKICSQAPAKFRLETLGILPLTQALPRLWIDPWWGHFGMPPRTLEQSLLPRTTVQKQQRLVSQRSILGNLCCRSRRIWSQEQHPLAVSPLSIRLLLR